MEGGSIDSGGRNFSRAASTAWRSASKKSGRIIAGAPEDGRRCVSGLILAFGFKRLGRQFAVGFVQQNLDFAFRFFELLLALAGKLHALFEKLHGVVERQLRALQTSNDFFESRERTFEVRFF